VNDLLVVSLLLVFVEDCLKDLFRLLLALVERIVVGADDQDAKVDCEITDVNVKDELLGDSWDADRSPGFATVFHARVCENVVEQDLDILAL